MTGTGNSCQAAAMSAADRSQTDLEVLRSSHRGKFITLGVLLAAAGGVWWFVNRTGPIGQDEDPARVLVVNQSHLRYKPYLEQWGFVAQEGRAETIEEESHKKLPELELTGVPAIMQLADWAGYAYVAFENPQKVDFGGLEVEGGIPSFEPWQRFAVVSAGDYAFPHKLTVSAEPSKVMNGPDLDLLTALFAQDPLAGTLREDPKDPPIVMVLRTKLKEGMDRLTSIADAEATVAKIAEKARTLLVDKEQGDPKPALLGGIHESLNAIALADGSTLVMSRAVHFSSNTGYNAELELDRNWQFSYLAPGAAPGSARQPCTSLLGGTLEESGSRPIFRSSPRGDALLVHLDGASQVWRLEQGAGKEPCSFTLAGKVTLPLSRNEDPGDPQASGRIARGRRDGEDSVVYIAKPGEEVPIELARSPSINFALPAWIAEDWVAAAGYSTTAATGGGVYMLSPAHPDHALRLEAITLDASHSIDGVAPAPDGPNGPRLLVAASSDRGQRLFRVDLARPWAGLYEQVVAADTSPAPQAVVDGTEPHVHVLDGAAFTATTLTQEGWVSDMVAAPDGSAVAFQIRDIDNGVVDADNRREIGLVALDGSSPLRLLTRNGLEDHTPMFTADSKAVLFRTRFSFEKTNWILTTARSVPAQK